jgi:DHA2 family multidrug resistance protein
MVATFILSLVSYMPSVVTPLFLQHVQGYGVLGTGLILTPRFIGMAGGMLLMSRIVDKVDQRVLVSLGLGLTLCGFASLRDLTPITPAIVLIGAGILQALGTSVTMVPLNLSTFTTISSEMRPMAMAIYNLARGTSQSLGTALTLSYISRSTEDNHVRLLQQISVYNPVMTGSMPAEWSLTNPLSLKLLSLEVWRQASVIAYDNVFSIACLSSIACFPIVLILRKKAQGEYHKSAPEDRQESADALDIVHAG